MILINSAGKISSVLIFSAFLLIAGCEKVDMGRPFDVSIGKRYRVSNSLSFSIDSLKDYRCPADLMCIWSGDVELYFRIHHNFSTEDTTIYFLTRQNNPFKTGGYTFGIKDVAPHLKSGETIKAGDYRINMVITEN